MTSPAAETSTLLPSLDRDQGRLAQRITAFCDEHLATGSDRHRSSDDRPAVFLVQGAAGTGKSALLSQLFVALSARSRLRASADPMAGARIRLLVNHAEMWRRYRDLAGQQPALRKMQVMRPTPYINAAARDASQRADIALVDEGHLLLTRADPYTRFRGENQLADIIRASRITVVVYDDAQVLRMRSHWSLALLERVIGHATLERGELHRQHRMGASLEVREWIDRFVSGGAPVCPPPAGDASFSMQVFDDAGALYRWVRSHQAQGSARMLSTYDYPYALDGRDHFIDEPGLHVRWDRYRPEATLPWPERPDSADEVGSVYTVQGLDVDWAGVLLGPSVVLGDDDCLRMLPDRYEDRAALSGGAAARASGSTAADARAAHERILRDALLTLLTRPRRGLGISAHDPALRRALDGRPNS